MWNKNCFRASEILKIGFLFLGLIMPGEMEAQLRTEKAIFAGGCFWCLEAAFEPLAGVRQVVSGYTGGGSGDPNYGDYAQKGHLEAIEITYDPDQISYAQLLDVFWRQIDPTDAGGQFVDRGSGYSSAIFYLNEAQKKVASAARTVLEGSGRFTRPIVTRIAPAGMFYPAEDYHQDYYKTHSWQYDAYNANSGRKQFQEKIWGN